MMQRNKVCTAEPYTKDKFQRKLAQAWSRIWPKLDGGQLEMAAKMGLTDTSVIKRGVSADNLPSAHHVINSLLADPSALDEVMAEVGFCVRPIRVDAANDIQTAAGVINAMGELVRSQDDHHRDHNETLAIAQLLRPHIPALMAIIAQADELRDAA